MAYRLTEETIYKIEHKIIRENSSSMFEFDTDEERARVAFWMEGVRDMAVAVIDAMKELKK